MAVLPTGIGPVTGYNIERSLRFNSADSAYLNRTPASAGNRKIFTLNQWVKRAELGTRQVLFSAGTGANAGHEIEFQSDNTLAIYSNSPGASVALATTQVFRDPSAWGMLTFAFDTTQATASNRLKVYWNGVQITVFASSDYPAQNADMEFNNNVPHNIGRREIGTTFYCGLYLTEVNFIDGQALTPSSFGETDSSTGVWKAKKYAGTYGTNGFYLNFADNSGTTSTTLGKDSSGNGNNWTPNNFSVTAGVGNDSLVDSPTSYGTDTGVGGEVRGNYATWNPLYGSTPTLTNGNLDATTNNTTAYGTVSVTSGKWYWEILVGNAGYIGVMDSTYIKPDGSWSSQAIAYVSNGNKYNGTGSAYGASYTTNDIIGVALDMDAGTIVFYKNGSSQGTAFSSGIAGKEFRPFVYSSTSGTQTANFGQRAFAYTAPSGFKALCTQNLPTPTIGATSTTQANDYFNVVTYTGTLTTIGSNQLVTGVGFQPDMTWIKCRSNAADNIVADAIRYVSTSDNNYLVTNSTAAEADDQNTFRGFASDGFNVGYYDVTGNTGKTYVAWNWNAGGSNATNTSGTITSTVRANTTSGFSIVTYTGNGTSGATVGHGLGVAPKMVIVKNRGSSSFNWPVYHESLSSGNILLLNTTDAQFSFAAFPSNPSSSVFTVGSWGGVNVSTNTYVAYCFAPVAGYSDFGSYTGNGSTDGPFVYLGFRARWILIKSTGASEEHWMLYDTARNTYNVSNTFLMPSASNAELTTRTIDINSNGFKVRDTDTKLNTNAEKYIYAAFAETPFRYSLAR
jgi:hypothetical protein